MIGEALAQPITDLIDEAGTGALPPGGPSDRMRTASDGLRAAVDTGVTAAGAVGTGWSGADADACACTASGAARAGAELSERGEGIATVVEEAAASVQRGVAELGGILESFLSIVACQGPALATPAGQVTVLAAAADHIEQALAVVGRMRGELEVHAGEMAQFVPEVPLPPVPNPNAVGRVAAEASGAVSDGVSSAADDVRSWAAGIWGDIKNEVDGFFGDAGQDTGGDAAAGADAGSAADGDGRGCGGDEAGLQGGAASDGAGSGDGAADGADTTGVGAAGVADVSGAAGAVGGVPVTLPDGTTVTAPNAHAADAVQAALTQRGVPYSWGGEAPGQGLDCSGLTQWAYGQAGVDLPRVAQAQSVGPSIPADQVAPGDLAVWDGHVAMVVGDGRMIEAGDPVTVDPVRTTNAGMQFRGFYRPTAA